MLDKVDTKAAITATTGALVITSKIYCNNAMAAAFSAVSGATVAPVVTVGTGFINVVCTVTPDAAVGVTAEAERFLQPYGKDGAGTVTA